MPIHKITVEVFEIATEGADLEAAWTNGHIYYVTAPDTDAALKAVINGDADLTVFPDDTIKANHSLTEASSRD